MILPMRTLLMGHHFSKPIYGRLMDLQLTLVALATAGGPLAAGVLPDALGSYALLLPRSITLLLLLLLAIPTILAAKRRPEATV